MCIEKKKREKKYRGQKNCRQGNSLNYLGKKNWVRPTKYKFGFHFGDYNSWAERVSVDYKLR